MVDTVKELFGGNLNMENQVYNLDITLVSDSDWGQFKEGIRKGLEEFVEADEVSIHKISNSFGRLKVPKTDEVDEAVEEIASQHPKVKIKGKMLEISTVAKKVSGGSGEKPSGYVVINTRKMNKGKPNCLKMFIFDDDNIVDTMKHISNQNHIRMIQPGDSVFAAMEETPGEEVVIAAFDTVQFIEKNGYNVPAIVYAAVCISVNQEGNIVARKDKMPEDSEVSVEGINLFRIRNQGRNAALFNKGISHYMDLRSISLGGDGLSDDDDDDIGDRIELLFNNKPRKAEEKVEEDEDEPIDAGEEDDSESADVEIDESDED